MTSAPGGPIVAGRAVKGPLASMIESLTGNQPSAAAVVRHYGGLLSGIVVEPGDENEIDGTRARAAPAVMRSCDDRLRLASEALELGAEL